MKARILKKLEDEVATLERELRTDLPKEIKRARELGDLSENAEFQAAKERQSYVQARLAMIRKRMAEIALMNLERLPTDRAAFGSTVKLKEDGTDAVVTYHLVMPEDADATKGLISTSSPIGRAIVGKQAGDEITVPTPTGVRRFEMVTLTTIHDEA
jgi:transcription elongation factor GreA